MKNALIALAAGLLSLALLIAGAGLWLSQRLAPTAEPAVAATATRTRIAAGEIIGTLNNGAHAWLGIPYAAPPVGDLRWRAPRALPAWQAPRAGVADDTDAPRAMLTPGEQCLQSPRLGRTPQGSEDCLLLNVWAPAGRTQPLPVMVWIHGGGNQTGSAGSPLYNGAALATSQQVVVVSVNYRLGALGWFLHPELAAAPAPDAAYLAADASGNFGTLDLLAALTWVRTNAHAFGGDPNNVTLFGESAGGFNVLSLMVSPLAQGLFHKAIVQSGALTLQTREAVTAYRDAPAAPGHPRSSVEIVNTLLEQRGVATDRDHAISLQEAMTSTELSAFLRSLPAAEIVAAGRAATTPAAATRPFVLGGGPRNAPPTLFADGYVLPQHRKLAELFAEPDAVHSKALLIGSNRDEARLFNALKPGYVDSLWRIPRRISDPQRYARDSRYGSDLWKALGVDAIAEHIARHQPQSVFAYRFDWDDWRELPWLNTQQLLGAPHAAELPFVFGTTHLLERAFLLAAEQRPMAEELSRRMMSYWGQFAHTGAPGRGRDGQQPYWPPWRGNPDRVALMVLDSRNPAGSQVSIENRSITAERLAEDLQNDPRFDRDEPARCALAQQLAQGTTTVDVDFTAGSCPAGNPTG